MRILITGANTALARAVLAALPDTAQIRLVDTTIAMPATRSSQIESFTGDLCNLDFAAAAVAGMDTIIHLAPLALSGNDLADLDRATHGSYHLFTAAAAAAVRRFILGSSLALFDRLPLHWKLDERWRPRPTSAVADLCPWLSELCVRELARDLALPVYCMRFAALADEASSTSLCQLSAADVGIAIREALSFDQPGWSIRHVSSARNMRPEAAPGPWRSFLQPPDPVPARSIRKVVIFGAGGPLASMTALTLAPDYVLRRTDIEPLAQITARNNPQLPGAPLPQPLPAPHEEQVVDITDYNAVSQACDGVDAIINCAVIRHNPELAFRVNTLGSYNVMRAAVAHGINRVVHTGPYQVAPIGTTSYPWDYDIPDDAPPRPGCGHPLQMYFHSKLLGQEICHIFADYHGLTVPILLFVQFVNPQHSHDIPLYPFAVSWHDAARAIRRALEIPTLPSPSEVFHVSVDLPHGVFRSEKVHRLLGWEPQDLLSYLWQESDDGT